ncbi:MAG: serine/threonine-protein kinase HipA [Chlamydiales bacterium]|jgi:serine/threonine-protein kinase HipA
MEEREVFVYVDLDGVSHFVGRLWTRIRGRRQMATFQYDQSWLDHPEIFPLDPALGGLYPTRGQYQADEEQKLFGAICDSSPDRWGSVLMKRAETRRAREAGEPPRTLFEIDYLLTVNDHSRQGALRFADAIGGPFLDDGGSTPIPPLVKLGELLSISEKVLDDTETAADLRLLLVPGSSLGGGRPKTSVIDNDGQLAIAKFPQKDDDYSTVEWESVALELAEIAGIDVPIRRLEEILGKKVIIIKRFDRVGGNRVPFLSAMSMIGARGHDDGGHSYLELVDALTEYGAHPKRDKAELWRRIVFSILISNTDDHLRNHGFLYVYGRGWELSPVYDLNPTPVEKKQRVLALNIDLDSAEASLELVLSVADEFGLKPTEARAIAKKVGDAVSQWRDVAANMGIKAAEITRMASAFDHDDLQQAIRL